MKRVDLEHIIRAAAAIANDDEIVVIGSQAILGSLPDAPEVLLSVLLTRCDALALAETERQAIKERLQRWALVKVPR